MDFRQQSNGDCGIDAKKQKSEMTDPSSSSLKAETKRGESRWYIGPISPNDDEHCPNKTVDNEEHSDSAVNESNNSNACKVTPESPSSLDDIFSTPHSSVTSLNRTLPQELESNNDCNCALLKKPRRLSSPKNRGTVVSNGVMSESIATPNRNTPRTYQHTNHRKSKYALLFKCCMAKSRKKDRHERSVSTNSEVFARQESVIYADDIPDEPLRKRIIRACFTLLYFLLATVAVVVTYSMVSELVHSMNNPVRSIHYQKNDIYEAPGMIILIYSIYYWIRLFWI